jgi:hypothetical protein
MRNAYRILVRKLQGRIPLRTLKKQCIIKKYGVKVWTGFNWLRTGIHGGL